MAAKKGKAKKAAKKRTAKRATKSATRRATRAAALYDGSGSLSPQEHIASIQRGQGARGLERVVTHVLQLVKRAKTTDSDSARHVLLTEAEAILTGIDARRKQHADQGSEDLMRARPVGGDMGELQDIDQEP